MKVLVCGGRDFTDARAVHETLYPYKDKIGILIEGGADGADSLAAEWAFRWGIHTCTVPALWHLYGKRAGPIRNKAMLKLAPDLVFAFPGGSGTANMVKLAKENGVKVIDCATGQDPID